MIRIIFKYNSIYVTRLLVLTLILLISVFLLRRISFIYKNILLLVKMDNMCNTIM
ncbi:SWPV1-188 [Shearwaterpox virus]|uniref:SWPV1-188 n=1 Tax=Shearwaterpox virus TaxID=1974596 RepID=A0A1V0S807_CNPV|nr:SWPV1-188 [Shearwaterpox virus]